MPQQMAWGGSACNYCGKICLSLTLYKERFFSPGDSKLSVLQMQIWSLQGSTMVEMSALCAGSKTACLSC